MSLSLIPMLLLVLGVTRRLRCPMNPAFVFQQIFKIPKTYFLASDVLAALIAAHGVVVALTALLIAISPVQLYLFVLLTLSP